MVSIAPQDPLEKVKRFWYEEIKPLAERCTEGFDKLEEIHNTPDQEKGKSILLALEQQYGHREWFAVWYIEEMIRTTENALRGNRHPRFAMALVHEVLNSEEYYKDFFKGRDCDEMRNYRALGQKVSQIMSM